MSYCFLIPSQHAYDHLVMQLAIPSLTAGKSSCSEGGRSHFMLMSVSRCCESKSILLAESGANRERQNHTIGGILIIALVNVVLIWLCCLRQCLYEV